MKKSLTAALVAASLAILAAPVLAGPVERACMKSDRRAANRVLCNCIQAAADQTLTGAEQRRAAGLFNDPDKAHKVWLSKSDRDDEFWKRYKAFGAAAEAMCSG
jgi:hypothetical protein